MQVTSAHSKTSQRSVYFKELQVIFCACFFLKKNKQLLLTLTYIQKHVQIRTGQLDELLKREHSSVTTTQVIKRALVVLQRLPSVPFQSL